jgi:hypothetical protein
VSEVHAVHGYRESQEPDLAGLDAWAAALHLGSNS